ncbi:MAG: diheme cytochrome c [Gammaproteobacteria bacterium]|nr:diheme cytochrome c [Gammaproteobacteria bacterium]
MKKPFIILSVLAIVTIISVPVVFSDDDRRHYRQRSLGVAPVSSPLYKAECSSCHMAYPAGLLPSASWRKLMNGLSSHFGDNAEIDEKERKLITEYLITNSAEYSEYRRSQKIMKSLKDNEVPLRISETPYIVKEHDELPEKMVKYNNKVNSLANCNACHLEAEKGIFDEHKINIPGFGRWHD